MTMAVYMDHTLQIKEGQWQYTNFEAYPSIKEGQWQYTNFEAYSSNQRGTMAVY